MLLGALRWKLLKLDGVVDTRCGYAGPRFLTRSRIISVCVVRQRRVRAGVGDGGKAPQCVRVTYDEARVSYEDVLDAAFAASKPVLGSRQYAPIVFAGE